MRVNIDNPYPSVSILSKQFLDKKGAHWKYMGQLTDLKGE